MRAFRRVAAGDDLSRARAFSERCHAAAADGGSWDALDFCVAFDHAAFLRASRNPRAFAANGDYFVDRHDRAAHFYTVRLSSLDAIRLRLDRIRGQVAPPRDERLQARVLHGLAKRSRQFAGAVRDVLDLDEVAPLDGAGRPRDF